MPDFNPLNERWKKQHEEALLHGSFRNMLVHHAMDNCSQKEVKAISQNLGHEHVATTYNAYGKQSSHEQRKAILGIGKGNPVTV